MNELMDLSKNNKGASLIIIVAVFALIMVLSMNVVMAANVTTTGLEDEFESEQLQMYVSSVYDCINQKILAGEITGLFESGKTHRVDFTGFDEDVYIEATKPMDIKDSVVVYHIAYKGQLYQIQTIYLVSSGFITVKSCSGLMDM